MVKQLFSIEGEVMLAFLKSIASQHSILTEHHLASQDLVHVDLLQQS